MVESTQSCNFDYVLLKKPKRVCDSVPLTHGSHILDYENSFCVCVCVLWRLVQVE